MPLDETQGPLPGAAMAPVEVLIVGPVPVAAPNAQFNAASIPVQPKKISSATLQKNIIGRKPMSIGSPGTGVASGTCMSMVSRLISSICKIVCTGPATRSFIGMTLHNLSNMIGMPMAPSQIKEITLK
ncbi:MAG: hypothetical protein AAFX39_01695 [Pseudomonadota bacterium]